MSRKVSLTARTLALLAVGAATLILGSPARDASAGTPAESASQLVPGIGLTLPFPRIASWYPDPSRQPLADIARYDYVVFYRGDAAFVPAAKALNPDLIALTKANASNIPYDADQGPDGAANQQLAQVPAQWLLTQVGSRLAEEVSPRDSVLHLGRVTLDSGGTTYRLFVPGDSVVIDDEITYVRAVDREANTITVRRGRVKPAESHAAGARVAATISTWPGMLVMDASSGCPAVTVDAAVGPETWADYCARKVALLLADPPWDGIMLDCSDGGKSWVVGAAKARSIDPDRSNGLVLDYRAFDAAWNAGMQRLHDQVRRRVGWREIVVGNNSLPSYASLNGNSFEGFPDDTGYWHGITPWAQLVVGPSGGSYFEWIANAQQPNLTTIATYQSDGGPDTSEVDVATTTPANYRKMRLGLCTALLGDGFFSYELNTDGRAALGLFWFDEYDNAGQQLGYLGQPLGQPYRVTETLGTSGMVISGGFDIAADLNAWRLLVSSGHSASMELDATDSHSGGASLRADIDTPSGEDYRVQIMQKPIPVAEGVDYTLSFWAKADHPRAIGAAVQRNTDPWSTWLKFGQVDVSQTWQHYVLCAEGWGSDPTAGLYIKLGHSGGTVWLDDVQMQRGSLNAWRRDFEGGLVLANPSSSRLTVGLQAVYRKIKGHQAPAVNDGSLVARVTVPPKDGLVLLRPTTSPEITASLAASQLQAEWRRCARHAWRARSFYTRLLPRTTGSVQQRAMRAQTAWKKAWTTAAKTRASAGAWQRALDCDDPTTARLIADATVRAAVRARDLIRTALSRGRAAGSGARASRSARIGRDKLLTAMQALVQLP